jgi:nucleotide-binding universal stress UspA family protein
MPIEITPGGSHVDDRRSTSQTRIVGFDGSDESRAALSSAIERSEPDDMIVVINAYARVADWMGHPYYLDALHHAQAAARRVLEEAAGVADGSPAEVAFEIHEGPPAEVLARVGTLREAEEIIVGTRGLGRIRAALGSVAQELVRTADRPVLVVPARVAQAA